MFDKPTKTKQNLEDRVCLPALPPLGRQKVPASSPAASQIGGRPAILNQAPCRAAKAALGGPHLRLTVFIKIHITI